MAIARGAGTEIIRCIHLEEVDSATRNMIYGVQHHIYTVLSVICYAQAVQADRNYITMLINGYDTQYGSTNRNLYIFQQDMSLDETFVWNDKFSFNGFEPTDFAGPMDDATKQDAIADQGSGVTQTLKILAENAADDFEITCTYIDQNNA